MGGASTLGFEHFLISTDGVVRVLLGVLGIMSVSARYLIVSKTIAAGSSNGGAGYIGCRAPTAC
jgi:hypothetical protein